MTALYSPRFDRLAVTSSSPVKPARGAAGRFDTTNFTSATTAAELRAESDSNIVLRIFLARR